MARKRLEKTVQDPPLSQPEKNRFYCCRCGLSYSRQKGYFPVSHSPMYRGTGYLPMCNECIEELFDQYRREFRSDRDAMRRMCMKLDLYWNDKIFDMTEKSAGVHSKIRNYIGKTNIIHYIDKNYDNTIQEENEAVIDDAVKAEIERRVGEELRAEEERIAAMRSEAEQAVAELHEEVQEAQIEVPDDIILFWGPGYTPKMYLELEERRKYLMSRYPEGYEFDIGEEALIRQICNLEISINHDRVAGKPIDKSVNTLNTLLGSANLKPAQREQRDSDAELENMPFGVGIRKWENTRPVPEPDPELQDVDGIVKYVTVWFLGHLCKMLGIKNTYCKLYEEEMERLRVQAPEFEDEDDEAVFNNIFSKESG